MDFVCAEKKFFMFDFLDNIKLLVVCLLLFWGKKPQKIEEICKWYLLILCVLNVCFLVWLLNVVLCSEFFFRLGKNIFIDRKFYLFCFDLLHLWFGLLMWIDSLFDIFVVSRITQSNSSLWGVLQFSDRINYTEGRVL